MKVSIITVVWNNCSFIKDAIESVLSQTYDNIEYIIIDGSSTDGTVDIIKSYREYVDKFISEEDDGLYDAMNKGISLASGDIVGILNSDDFYINENVVSRIVDEFIATSCDSVYSDLVYVNPKDINTVVRYYDSSYFSPDKFANGWMPAHPTFFVKRSVYLKLGLFRTDLAIGSDFDILVRFLARHRISYSYIDEALVKMRVGGVSTQGLRANLKILKEQKRVCADHGIETNFIKLCLKYPQKLMGIIGRER